MKASWILSATALAAVLGLANCAGPHNKKDQDEAMKDQPPKTNSQSRYLVDDSSNPAGGPTAPPTTGSPDGDPGAPATPPPPSQPKVEASGGPPVPPPPSAPQYPYAKPVPGKKGFVLSPYDDKAGMIDVRDYTPGQKVRDPYTNKIFLVP